MSAYRLAIDYGTSRSGAAIADLPTGEARTVFVNGRSSIASVVVLREGELLVGEAAENAAGIRPAAAVASPKRFLGQHQPLFREPRRIEPEEAVAATLRALVAEAAASREGRSADEVFLTYPARWGATRQAAFREAAKQAGIESPYLIPEPVAAALRLARDEGLATGAFVAVYDLGAGMFDTAVLQRTAEGFVIHGAPGGLELGGDSFDERLYRLLGKQLDAPDWDAIQNSDSLTWRRAQGDFRRRVRLAKEALSRSAWVDVQYPGPADHEPIRLTRQELDDQIRPDITATLNELDRTINAAGLTRAGLAAVYAAGGSSRIPLVEAMIVDAFGPSVRVQNDTMNVGALGAASASWAALEGTVSRQPPSADAAPVVPRTPADAPPPVAPPPVAAPIAWPAPPPNPAASPVGSRSGARPRTPLVLAGIAAAAVGAIVLSQVIGLFGGSPASSSLVAGQGSPGPVSAAPGAGVERSAAQATLLGILPADVRERCQMAADNVAPGGGERAAVTCPGVLGGSGHFVDYFLFANDDQMTSAFNRFVATRVGLGEALDLTCPGRWEIASEEAGDLACFVVKPTSEFPSGQAYMAWTAEGSATLAIAARPDPFIGALHATMEKLRIR